MKNLTFPLSEFLVLKIDTNLKTWLQLVCICFICQNQVLSQCNLTVDAGPDQSECDIPTTFQLQGTVSSSNPILSIFWTPATGLSDPFSLNTTATVSVPTIYTLSASTVDFSNNLVVNGDFSGGNSGFTTDYTFNANPSITANPLNEGQYSIGTNPAPMHINWVNCGDHTTGSGNMMLVNGHETPGQNVWCQTVTVTPNTDYIFSAWVTSVDPNGPCEIQFNINGSPLGAGNLALSATCTWLNFYEPWNSGAITTATICIEDLNTAVPGNDFAIDDIVFAPVCVVTDSVTLTPSMVNAFATNNGPLFCEGETLELSAGDGDTYEWSGPSGFSASGQPISVPNLTVQNDGTYTVTVTNSEGCTAASSTFVTMLPSSTVNLSETTCDSTMAGVFTQNLTNQQGCDSTVITTVTWMPSSIVSLSETTCDSSAVGVFTQGLTNQFGCDSTVITTVTLDPSSTVNLSETTCDSTAVGVFVQNLTNQYGCDSTVTTTVTLDPSNFVNLLETTCDSATVGIFTQNLSNQFGCDSTVVTTVVFDEEIVVNLLGTTCDSTEVGVFTQNLTNQLGCDSTVITTVTLDPSNIVNHSETTCDTAVVGVFTEIFTNQYGCDSTVVTTVSLDPSNVVNMTTTTCDSSGVGVFTEILTNQYGCDSTVITTVTLDPSTVVNLTATTCDSSAVGVFTQNLTNQFGCDSNVITTVTLVQEIVVNLSETTCDSTQVGIFTQSLTSQSGCDSTVITTVTLDPSNLIYLSETTCDSSAVDVFTEIFTNQFGCDSTVITTVSLNPNNIVNLSETTCDLAAAGVFIQNLTNQFGCDSTVITTVTLLPSNIVNLSETTCDSSLVGVFTQNMTNQFGCDSTVITTVSLLPQSLCEVIVSLEGSVIPCSDDSGSLTIVATVGEAPFDYILSGPTSSSGVISMENVPEVIDNLPAGTYTVTVTSAVGLTITAQATITQNFPPEAIATVASDYNGMDISCAGNNDGSATVAATGGIPPYQFEWSNGDNSADITQLAASIYAVTVTDMNECTDIAEVILAEPDPLNITFTVNDLNCFSQNSGGIITETMGGTMPYTFSLNGGTSQPSGDFFELSEGGYEVTMMDANGCATSEIISINSPIPVTVDLGDDLFIEFGDDVQLQAIVNVPFDSLASLIWQPLDSLECPDCLAQDVAPLITSTYSVSVTDVNGCADEDTLTVFVDRTKNVYVPNAFSPNGDGINDVFMVYAENNTVENIQSFIIFSRWGESVFQQSNFQPNDFTFGWSGTHNGEELNPAVFVWKAEILFKDGTKELFKGDVTLVK
ncbi:MAG: gliding motility-associated C-terminal domain-containing protein [Bacteroidota bacterium]